MITLEGKPVTEKIIERITEKQAKLTKQPCLAVLGIEGDDASNVYIGRIEKNCAKYNIDFKLLMAKDETEFKNNFNEVKDNPEITGIMFQEPLPHTCASLINELPAHKDVEGLNIINAGKLMLGQEDANIPCTSKAVIEVLDYYNIDITGKKVVIMGRSNIVGKPLIFQLLKKNATVTICHSKTTNLKEELQTADIIVMAIGKVKFLTKDYIKENAILIDVGINFEDGKMVGDIDFESIQDKASMCTPVPGGIGPITNVLLIENIITNALRD